ncbi:MAG: HupE/UreJ family protein, partial [Verrucomicrobia bacterium]
MPALAHEVRPALVQIVETAPNEYVVTWKRPVVGDMALRLIP